MPPKSKPSNDMHIEQAAFVEGDPRPDDTEEAKASSVFEVCFLRCRDVELSIEDYMLSSDR